MSDVPVASSDGEALFQAFIMIVVSEIGDKTFLIAAIMATRHARITVFGGAFASLVVMSVLSAAMGRVILGLIPKRVTLSAAAVLFLAFGIKMLRDAQTMSASHLSEEMREAEEELEADSSIHDAHNAAGHNGIPLEALEEGMGSMTAAPSSPRQASFRAASPKPKPKPKASISFPLSNGGPGASSRKEHGGQLQAVAGKVKDSARRCLGGVVNPVFAQAFILTFLGEWGDRSQIATIALAGAHTVGVIAFGTIIGHGLCTAGAVMGGRYISTMISVKHITLIGAVAFLVFAGMYGWEAYNTVPGELMGLS